jgi:hypothetical protein
MIELYNVTYFESEYSDECFSKQFDLTSKRDATNFARSMSKQSGHRSSVYKSKGFYDQTGYFCSVDSKNIATYENGKRV